MTKRISFVSSGFGLATLAAAALGQSLSMAGSAPRPPRIRSHRVNELNRKQARVADRSKKQFLIKGIRP